MSKFIIFAQPRSGSTNLCTLLGTSPGHPTLHEPFSPYSGDGHFRDFFLLKTYLFHQFNRKSRFQEIAWDIDFHPFGREGVANFLDRVFEDFEGIKHLWTVCSYPFNRFILQYCMDSNIKIVVLKRNLFYAELSRILSEQVGIFQMSGHDINEKEITDKRAQIDQTHFRPVNCGKLFNRIIIHQHLMHQYEEMLQSYTSHTVHYEQLFEPSLAPHSKMEYLRSLCGYLDINPNSLSPKHVDHLLSPRLRQNPESIYSKIPNWKEIEELSRQPAFSPLMQ